MDTIAAITKARPPTRMYKGSSTVRPQKSLAADRAVFSLTISLTSLDYG